MTTSTFCRIAGAVALLVLVGAAAPSFGADKVKEASFGKGKGSGPLLTRAQLRDCMAQQDRTQAAASDNAKHRAELDREKADITAEGAALKDQLAALDRSSQEAVDQYNEKAAARDKRIDAFEARANEFNQKVEALQTQRTAFAAACENRRYDEADEIAIRKGK